jgi:large subunit ribosomal protein L14e
LKIVAVYEKYITCRSLLEFFSAINILKNTIYIIILQLNYVILKYGSLFIGFKGDTENMPAIEVGRICVKQLGRENGKKCVVIDVMDKSFVLVTGPKKVTGVKRRRVNINHIMPLLDKIEVKRGSSDEEIVQALEAVGKLQEMTLPVKTA